MADVGGIGGRSIQQVGTQGTQGADRTGEFAGRAVQQGPSGWKRVALAVVTLGISELVRFISNRSVAQQPAPESAARATRALAPESAPRAVQTRMQGQASPEFTREVENEINTASGLGGDLGQPEKYERGMHKTFVVDLPRATYVLDGEELSHDGRTAEAALKSALTEEQLKALSTVLHQGAYAVVVTQLGSSDAGFVRGFLASAPTETDEDHNTWLLEDDGRRALDEGGQPIPGRSTTYSIESNDDGSFKVTIHNTTKMQSAMLLDGEQGPRQALLDARSSFLETTVTGVIRPGQDPMFQITAPIDYNLQMNERP